MFYSLQHGIPKENKELLKNWKITEDIPVTEELLLFRFGSACTQFIKATLCSSFTLKYQLQNHANAPLTVTERATSRLFPLLPGMMLLHYGTFESYQSNILYCTLLTCISQLVSKCMCTASSVKICIYSSGVKVNYAPHLQGEHRSNKCQYSHNATLTMLPFPSAA